MPGHPSLDQAPASSVGRAFVYQAKGSLVQIQSGARYPRSSAEERPTLNSEGREINTRRGCKANVSLNHTGYSSEVERPAGCWWSQVRVLLARQLTSTLVVFVVAPPTLLSACRKQGNGKSGGGSSWESNLGESPRRYVGSNPTPCTTTPSVGEVSGPLPLEKPPLDASRTQWCVP